MGEYLTKIKFSAMWKEAREFYSKYPEQTWKNILSFGDSEYEHDAAQDLGWRRKTPARERLRIKTIVTPTCPGIKALTNRLRIANAIMPAYINFDGNLDVDLNTPDRLRAIADALEMPELRNVIPEEPLEEVDEAKMEADLTELTAILHDRLALQ